MEEKKKEDLVRKLKKEKGGNEGRRKNDGTTKLKSCCNQ